MVKLHISLQYLLYYYDAIGLFVNFCMIDDSYIICMTGREVSVIFAKRV